MCQPSRSDAPSFCVSYLLPPPSTHSPLTRLLSLARSHCCLCCYGCSGWLTRAQQPVASARVSQQTLRGTSCLRPLCGAAPVVRPTGEWNRSSSKISKKPAQSSCFFSVLYYSLTPMSSKLFSHSPTRTPRSGWIWIVFGSSSGRLLSPAACKEHRLANSVAAQW